MTDLKGSIAPRSPNWPKVALMAILLLDVWWRCHTIGPTVRDRLGIAPWPVVSGEGRPLVTTATRRPMDHRPEAGPWRGHVPRRLREQAAARLLAVYPGRVDRRGERVDDPVDADPLRARHDRPHLVAWPPAPRSGNRVPGCLALRDPQHRPVPVRQQGEHGNTSSTCSPSASLAAMVRSFGVSGATMVLVLAGVLVGAASLVKQVAALHGLIYAVALLFRSPGPFYLPLPPGEGRGEGRGTTGDSRVGLGRTSRDKQRPSPPAPLPGGEGSQTNRFESLGSKTLDLVALAGGFLVIWGLAVGVLWLQGAGSAAFDDIVRYSSALATIKVPEPHAPSKLVRWFVGNADPEGHLPPPFGKTKYLVWWGTGSWPLWLAAVPSTAWLLVGRGRSRRLVGAWTLSSWVQVALPGLFWQHYYLVPTPGVALVVAVALGDVASLVGSSFRPLRFGRVMLGSIACLWLISSVVGTLRLQVRDYLMVAPEDLTTRFKGGRQWVVLRSMGRELGRRSKAWDKPSLYIWGWQSPLSLFSSGLDGPTRHFFADPLLWDPRRDITATTPASALPSRADRLLLRPGGSAAVDDPGRVSAVPRVEAIPRDPDHPDQGPDPRARRSLCGSIDPASHGSRRWALRPPTRPSRRLDRQWPDSVRGAGP